MGSPDRTEDHPEHSVAALLIEQHAQIRSLFDEVLNAKDDLRADAFFRLRRLLAVHETAEEQFVHPRMRWAAHDDGIANDRLHEETAAKQMLVELEKLDPESDEFHAGLVQLRDAVLEHAAAEEREEFPLLDEHVKDQRLLRNAVALTEKIAPTRPHPGVTLGGENALTGGFLSMVDRARDLLTRPHVR